MQAFRRKARALGVTYVTDEVVDVVRHGRVISGVTLKSGDRIACGTLVNAAGANGCKVAALAGVDIPVVPKKRFVYTFHCKQALAGVAQMSLGTLPTGAVAMGALLQHHGYSVQVSK
jgi:glycine/D-amino acid oxidase-like deaminating enzyme